MKQTDQELWAVAAEYYKLKSEGKNPIAQYYEPSKNIWYDHEDHHGFGMPDFASGDIWRLKPETIKHRGGEYPKPCTDVDELMKAEFLYTPSFIYSDNGGYNPDYIKIYNPAAYSKEVKIAMAKSGLYYLNRDDAIARAKVIYEID